MKRRWIPTAALAMLATASLWPGGEATASNEIAKKEGLVCTACHTKPGSKLLTDEGKYYELMRSTDGYDQVIATFGQCTSCHARKPGSDKLTANGRRFARLVGDMEGLRLLLEKKHPKPEADPQATEPEKAREGDGTDGGEPD